MSCAGADRPPRDLLNPRVVRCGTGDVCSGRSYVRFGQPHATQTCKLSQASGLGDLLLRTSITSARVGGGLAAAVDVRLPTGDENELLGAGGAQAKFMLVASTERGRLGQHVNVGYTAAEGEVAGTLAGLTSTPLPDEINYSGGIEFVANPRLTVMGDIVGRTLRAAGRLELASKTFEYTDPARFPASYGAGNSRAGHPSLPTSSVALDELNPRPAI